ncbi:hypothetical protein DL546_000638 [Coniochaeta pulveracea]|uniref:DUF6590 domain-containing protein n=1 Tax=Coniochaeta pulveracea TaxID=177199 RepID=A0A420Y3I6_9PEZI|nr:hypothetical protein DL546_000638 [Coniochaeta pulveracea]
MSKVRSSNHFTHYRKPNHPHLHVSCVTGEVYHRWQNEQNEEPATPRTAQVDYSMAGQLAKVQLDGPHEDAAPSGGDGYDLATEQSPDADGQGKGKAVHYGAAGNEGAGDGYGGGSGEGSSGDGGGTWPADPFLGRNDAVAGDPHDQEAAPDQEYNPDYRYDQAPELQQGLTVGSETYAIPQQGDYVEYPQVEAGPSSTLYATHPNADEGNESTSRPMTNATTIPDIRNHIQGTPGDVERLDSRFRVVPSYMFQPGRVFKILWADPMGHGRQSAQDNFTENTFFSPYGGQFHAKIRRFIIVAQDRGHSTCVPIFTYMKQGCTKPGVKPEQHGIIHEVGTEPFPVPGEGRLGFRPVCMEMNPDVPEERLARESRVAYSKFITVEHNVKVLFIGSIVPADFDRIVAPAINTSWARKTHRPPREHHRERQHGQSTKHGRHGRK